MQNEHANGQLLDRIALLVCKNIKQGIDIKQVSIHACIYCATCTTTNRMLGSTMSSLPHVVLQELVKIAILYVMGFVHCN